MLRVRHLTIGYGADPVVSAIDLEVRQGQFVSLLGPSGSGKSSVLRAITGLMAPLDGEIALDLPASDVGFLFQDDALLPWRTAEENVALGMVIRGASRRDAREHAAHWLRLVGLDGLGRRYPAQLSGGQRKRVALAQVLALRPRLLLMDEPFASLDAIVRMRISEDLLGWVERDHLSVLLVTHDLEEAITLSDIVYVLSQGPFARIRSRREIAIARPRHVLDSRQHPLFGPLVATLWRDLEDTAAPASAVDPP